MSTAAAKSDADAVLQILRDEFGGYYDGFTAYLTGGCRFGHEWRCGGGLGFGGKLHHHSGRWHVSAYPEDLTPERAERMTRVNRRLNQMFPRRVAA